MGVPRRLVTSRSPKIEQAPGGLLRVVWATLAAIAISGCGLVLHGLDAWAVLRVPVGFKAFVDLRVVTTAVDCVRENPAWLASGLSCSVWPEGFAYNYPTLWVRLFDAVGWNEEATEFAGSILIALFGIGCALLLVVGMQRRRVLAQFSVLVVCGLSPPALLLMERGNVDIVVFVLLSASVLLYFHRLREIAAGIIAMAAVAKLFPAGAAIMLVTDPTRRRRTIVLFLVLSVGGLLVILADLPRIVSNTPAQPGDSFGVAAVPLWIVHKLGLPVDWTGPLPRLVGIVVTTISLGVLAGALFAWPASRPSSALRAVVKQIADDRATSILFLVGGGSFLAAYLVGVSWDYRLVVLIPAILALTRIDERGAWLLCGSLILGLFLSVSAPGPIQAGWDLVMLVIAPVIVWLVSGVFVARLHTMKT